MNLWESMPWTDFSRLWLSSLTLSYHTWYLNWYNHQSTPKLCLSWPVWLAQLWTRSYTKYCRYETYICNTGNKLRMSESMLHVNKNCWLPWVRGLFDSNSDKVTFSVGLRITTECSEYSREVFLITWNCPLLAQIQTTCPLQTYEQNVIDELLVGDQVFPDLFYILELSMWNLISLRPTEGSSSRFEM